jgi:hypothetical protein
MSVTSYSISLLAFLLFPFLLSSQTPTETPPSTKTLIEPWVVKAADGIERPNPKQHFNESYLPILYPSSHAANLLELKNGDVLCVWFSGSWECSSEVGIVMSRRAKDERDWDRRR